jgi:hypothetical protein
MVYFEIKNPNLGKCGRVLQWKMFIANIYYYLLWPFGILYDILVYFPLFWFVALRKIWQPWRCAGGELNAGTSQKQSPERWDHF